MRTQWWWNRSFEGLMGNLEDWVKANPAVTIIHMDWKYQNADNNAGAWYMIVLYK